MPEFSTRLEAALGPGYRIESELGGGGMSRVFLAVEVALLRQVVVKVLPPEMAASVNQDRFLREIQLAAGFQHPHIVPLLTAGGDRDLLWYTMPFIQGESLRARLAREGELPVDETISILREVTDALAYAHAKGVVHRDIKPDNVMLSGDHALVMDFGVAKAVTESTAVHTLTSVGMALGTPAYMAPEQAAGDPNVDYRVDLYALGAMAHEMLTGHPPFTGPTPQAILAAQLTETPTQVRATRPAVPEALSSLVRRCLEKRPADRWQQAKDLLPQLDAMRSPSGSAPATNAVQMISSGMQLALRESPVHVALLLALAAIAVLPVSWWLVQQLGLPDWVVSTAGTLVVLGLPIIFLAARRDRRRILARNQGTATAHPTGFLGRLMTLRGALAGGGLAFSTLAVGTAAFMGLRVSGIGPFATLVSAGVLEERGLLLVADFQTRAEDSTIAASITEALKIDLGQSPMVRLIEGPQIVAALERMGRPANTSIDTEIARDIAQREGAKAVITGEVSRLGEGYVLSVRVVSSVDGSTLLGARESAAGQANLIDAVDRISRKLREGIGESLRSIRAGERLEEVTTTSLEALRFYTQAQREDDAGRISESIRLWRLAIAADSGFAMAWRKLAVQLGNIGQLGAEGHAAAQRAFDLRNSLPRREADLATAFYYHVRGRRQEAIPAYERLLNSWPDDIASRNNLSILYTLEGRYADAETLLRVGTDNGAIESGLYEALIDAQLLQRKYEAAESTAARYAHTVPEATDQARYFRGIIAYTRGQYDRRHAILDSLSQSSDSYYQRYAATERIRLHLLEGQVQKAWTIADRIKTQLEQLGPGANAALLKIEVAKAIVDVAVFGRADEGALRLEEAMARYPLDSVPGLNREYHWLIAAAAVVGRPDIAAILHADFNSYVPRPARVGTWEGAWVEAVMAATRDDWEEAIRSARAAQRLFGCDFCRAFAIGKAFEQLGQTDSALVVYEDYATRPIHWDIGQEVQLPIILTRVGELYEARGNRDKAMEYYGRLLDLWASAEPELQGRVAEIRSRIVRLAEETG